MTGKTYSLEFTKHSQKDALKLKEAGLKEKAQGLLRVLEENPWQNPPPYEKLTGDLKGLCSRRINLQHRLVYEIHEREKRVRILRMWSHYED